ncbi:type I glyceraldehyde-3-phosphate dehydrogenase [Spirochaetia bacterium]|nr:type I glyceraldehyde-3-phosphate dehydrogenase [Spirochaetia bacterium]
MAVNIAINGFGLIGRLVFCQLLGDRAFEIAAINDSAKPELLTYLLKYETPQPFADLVSGPGFISLKGKTIKTYSETDLSKLPWKKLKADLVIDCTGPASKDRAAAHLAAGAKKILLVPPSAAYPGIAAALPLIVYGVNEKTITHTDRIIAAPSPAVSGLASLVKALNDFAPIRSGILTITGGEAADANTGAGISAAISNMIPELQGKLTGSVMIPNADSGTGTQAGPRSAFLLTAAVTGKNITTETLNRALKARVDPLRTLVLPIGEDLYQIQIAALCIGEDVYAAELVKILKYFAEPKAGPAKPAAGTAAKSGATKPVAGPKTPAAVKAGTAKKGAQRPAGGAKPVNPALPRKPLINFPK